MNLKKIKILVIDDDEDFRSYVCDFLEFKKLNVFAAADGEEGIVILKKEKIDIVITDMAMPKIEGIEIIMLIKIIRPNIKIIAVSGAVPSGIYHNLADGLDADVILSKPFKNQVLIDAIEKTCKEIS